MASRRTTGPPSAARARTARRLAALVAALAALAGGCDDEADVAPNDPGERAGPTLSGDLTTLRVDGTVLLEPLGHRAAERLRRRPGVDVTVTTTGVDNALDALCRREIEIALVDRAPTVPERRACARNGVQPRRFQIAHQAVAFYPGDRLAARVSCMSVGELRRLWRAGSDVERYGQLGDRFPSRPVTLGGPPLALRTDDFLTRAVVGREGSLRRDYMPLRGIPELQELVDTRTFSLSFYGLGLDHVQLVIPPPLAVDGGSGCVRATAAAVQSGRYEPLSRPLHLLTSRAGLEQQVVRDYVRYVLQRSNVVAGYPGVVPLDEDAADRQLAQLPAEARGDG